MCGSVGRALVLRVFGEGVGDLGGLAFDESTVHFLDGLDAFIVVGEVNEAVASGDPGGRIGDDLGSGYGHVLLLEVLHQEPLIDGKIQVAYVDALHASRLLGADLVHLVVVGLLLLLMLLLVTLDGLVVGAVGLRSLGPRSVDSPVESELLVGLGVDGPVKHV